MTHINSREAKAKGEEPPFKFNRRRTAVYGAVRELKKATDREVMQHLGLPDMNNVRPRLTELVDAGYLMEIGTQLCPTTKVSVRVLTADFAGRLPLPPVI